MAKEPRKGAAAKAGDEAATEALAAGSTTEEAQALGTVVEEKVDGATEGNADGETSQSPTTPSPDTGAAGTPPAPGDEADAVFDRRLARLQTIAEEAEFDGGSLFGDLRDCVLDLFKHRPKLWAAMLSDERRDVTRHIEGVVKTLLDRVVLVVAEDESKAIQATMLAAFNVKGEAIEAKIKLDHIDKDGLLAAYDLAGKRVVIIDASSRRFMGQRSEQDHGSDQADLPFGNDARPAQPAALPEPPAGDADLADGADQSSASERATAQAGEGDAWGIFDTGRSEWLINAEGGEDGWTGDKAEAGRWNRAEAENLLPEFNDNGADPSIALRQLD